MNSILLAPLIFSLLAIPAFVPHRNPEPMEGEYVLTRFEFSSILYLKENNRFKYKYSLGGCQGSIEGQWSKEENGLKLTSEKQTQLDESDNLNPFYPLFRGHYWRVEKRGIKPEKKVDTGCFQTRGIHKKVRKG
ncbi:MAG: hypothetical protein H7Z75_11610 [Ferruginibacter sp.]|nr:hypothetical protein [Cytophagales bacterium]